MNPVQFGSVSVFVSKTPVPIRLRAKAHVEALKKELSPADQTSFKAYGLQFFDMTQAEDFSDEPMVVVANDNGPRDVEAVDQLLAPGNGLATRLPMITLKKYFNVTEWEESWQAFKRDHSPDDPVAIVAFNPDPTLASLESPCSGDRIYMLKGKKALDALQDAFNVQLEEGKEFLA